ncbi:hypothetical protein IOCL2690_000577500 [Leishmania lindenbergi]|uniref:Uncharacterized protein n=1 Tax=Leishmania lindenbergi TaxID=651832 RepID=A0AAW3A5U2_9TRYP
MISFFIDVLVFALPVTYTAYHYTWTKSTTFKDALVHFGIDGVPDRLFTLYYDTFPRTIVAMAVISVVATFFVPALLDCFSLTVTTTFAVL